MNSAVASIRLVLLALLPAVLSAAPPYKFSLDGDEFDAKVLPVLGERLGAPAKGDLGWVQGIPFVLREPGHYRFRSDRHAPSCLYCTISDGPKFAAVVRVSQPADKHKEIVDPFSKLTPSEISALLGVELQALPSRWEVARRALEGRPVALQAVLPPGATALPPLPHDLHYLSIDASSSPAFRDFGELYTQRSLQYLDLLLPEGARVSLYNLCEPNTLRNLSIKGGSLIDANQAVPTQHHLRFLKLRAVGGLDSVQFARRMPRLRVLKVDDTSVSDLRSLAGLKDLRLLSANRTKAEALPPLASLPALRDLRLHSTPLADQKELIRSLRPKLNVLVKNWDPAIRTFEERDLQAPPPRHPILFIGSSSIRRWDLNASFPNLPALNRGFGGSELSDSLRYFDRLVLPCRPSAILLYAGDNDINNGETAEQVVADYRSFAAKVRTKLPDTHFAFLAIKPSPKRWNKWPEMHRANQAIRKLTEEDPHLHYLDTAAPLLGTDGKPKNELFVDDHLHLNGAGYYLWNDLVTAWLNDL